jgi:hypothetical protein
MIQVANATARNAPTEKVAGMTVYRLDVGRQEVWNGTRWAVPATTERGRDYTQPFTIATTTYATVASTTFTSLGGKLKLAYTGTVENANSGANRTADVQWLVDGVAFGGVTYHAPLVTGFENPAAAIGMEREYTAGAGAHTVALQTRASSPIVRNVLFSLVVSKA